MMTDKKPQGRPQTYRDEDILTALTSVPSLTTTDMLDALGVTHKTSLMTRLRRLEARGLITITPGKGPHPTTISLK